jgi:hypothetical protein
MFLTPAQVGQLVQTGPVQMGIIADKVFMGGLAYAEAELIQIEASSTFDPARYPFPITRISPNDFSAAPGDVQQAAELLARDETVLSVFLSKRPRLLGAAVAQPALA